METRVLSVPPSLHHVGAFIVEHLQVLERSLKVAGKGPADCLDEGFEVRFFAEGGGGVVLEGHCCWLLKNYETN